MERLCTLIADRLEPGSILTDRLFNWPGDVSSSGDSVPLRLTGALHALRLRGHTGLAAVYPPETPSDDQLWSAVSSAMTDDADMIGQFINNPPQTNEVRRAACLIGIGHWLMDRLGLPLAVSELGASAGLNLNWDKFSFSAHGVSFGPADAAVQLHPDWRGDIPPNAPPAVAERRGVDLNPLDPTEPADELRLLSYLWPDQPERQRITRAAVALSSGAPDKGDAIDWLEQRVTNALPGQTHLIYSTIAWQYFPAAAQARGTALIEAAGAKATDASPLAWFAMEADEAGPGAALTLRLWPGDLRLSFGRIDFHGRWVEWVNPV